MKVIYVFEYLCEYDFFYIMFYFYLVKSYEENGELEKVIVVFWDGLM